MLQPQEVVGHGAGDESKQHQQEFALLNQVRLARLEDDLGDVEHRLVGGQPVNLHPEIKADAQRAGDDERAKEKEFPRADLSPEELEAAVYPQIGDRQV